MFQHPTNQATINVRGIIRLGTDWDMLPETGFSSWLHVQAWLRSQWVPFRNVPDGDGDGDGVRDRTGSSCRTVW